MDLLSAWERWTPTEPPYVLDADRRLLKSDPSARATIQFNSWEEALEDRGFCKPGDKRLHLGLLPMPFIGDIRHASIYVLSLNPGLGPHDYFGESQVSDYRNALLANLQQRFDGKGPPFLFLDPRHSWHGGFRYWHGKLAKIILCFRTVRVYPSLTLGSR